MFPQPRAPAGECLLDRRGLLRALALGGALTALSSGAAAQSALLDTPFINEYGQTHVLRQWAGRPMLVNFYATWCAPCREEMPSMDALAAMRPDLAVLPISVDQGGVRQLRQFYGILGLRHMGIYQDPSGALTRAANVWGYPTTLLLDASGREVDRIHNAVIWTAPDVLAHIDGLLGDGPKFSRIHSA